MGKGTEVGNYNSNKDDNNNGPRKKINNGPQSPIPMLGTSLHDPRGVICRTLYHKNPTFLQLFFIVSF